jgi:glycosyltransferase involved in cell wall biosynthesis
MHKQIKLGLIFSANENWIGGTYYILNLISALKTLPQNKQPIITILSKNESDFELTKKTGYPFLIYRNPYLSERNFAEKVIDKVFKITIGKYKIDKRVSAKEIDVLFPANNEYVYEKVKNKIYWFPDFQHVHYPEFFDRDEINNRNELLKFIAESKQYLLLSSNASKTDWDTLAFNKNCIVSVIPFSVTHPSFEGIALEDLLKEYNLGQKYFIVCNQFWVHKNHFVVLKAIAELHKENKNIQFVFTGKQDDYRNPLYFKSITDFIQKNNLADTIKLPGLIDRKKQLKLMHHAIGVIQPSLFEGWSTVIEDAKSLGCTIIVSDLPVHKEQLQKQTAYFFNANDDIELKEKIKLCLLSNPTAENYSYKNNIEEFGITFSNFLEKVCC